MEYLGEISNDLVADFPRWRALVDCHVGKGAVLVRPGYRPRPACVANPARAEIVRGGRGHPRPELLFDAIERSRLRGLEKPCLELASVRSPPTTSRRNWIDHGTPRP